MSTRRTDYVMVAIKLHPKGHKISFEAFEKLADDVDGPFEPSFDDDIKMVYDGMNGDYVYFGKIVSKSNEEDSGLNISIGTSLPGMWAQDVMNQMDKHQIPNPRKVPPSLYVFTHWH